MLKFYQLNDENEWWQLNDETDYWIDVERHTLSSAQQSLTQNPIGFVIHSANQKNKQTLFKNST